MNQDTALKLRSFSKDEKLMEMQFGEPYRKFEKFLLHSVSGNGMVGENSYLILWDKKEIEELNNDYEVQEFLTDIILIGANGGDTAYGVNLQGEYIEVPFIGMDDEEVKVIAKSFDQFIDSLWNRKE